MAIALRRRQLAGNAGISTLRPLRRMDYAANACSRLCGVLTVDEWAEAKKTKHDERQAVDDFHVC